MKTIKTSIIPALPTITPGSTAGEINSEAICVFAATGFFLGKDAWRRDQTALQPATSYLIDEDKIINENVWWRWHYSPRDISLKQATEEFGHLFEKIIKELTKEKKVILPLSGGLDSRTQAAAVKRIGADVNSYSYEFQDGYSETAISEKIANAQGFLFQKMVVKPGYLWNSIDKLSKINGCYSEFTHPRQMSFI